MRVHDTVWASSCGTALLATVVQKAKEGKYQDVTVKVLKKMPNQEFVGEIVAAGREMMPNKYEEYEPEELAFILVESVEDKQVWRVALRITLLTQAIDEWGDEQDLWLNKWIRLSVDYPTENAYGQRALELFESNPTTSKSPDSVIEQAETYQETEDVYCGNPLRVETAEEHERTALIGNTGQGHAFSEGVMLFDDKDWDEEGYRRKP